MYSYGILKAAKLITPERKSLLEVVISALEDRSDWLSDREPESDGEVHDTWEEKSDDLENIIDSFKDCLDVFESYEDAEGDDKQAAIAEIQDAINEISDLLDEYQSTYGGLSRLTVTTEEYFG